MQSTELGLTENSKAVSIYVVPEFKARLGDRL